MSPSHVELTDITGMDFALKKNCASSQIVAATQACHKPLRQPRRLHRLITTTWGSREEGDVRVLMLQRDMKSRLYPVLVVVQ